ncbi:MAG: hypothetical protein K0Q47_1436 [Sedimentibacter sp.]|jgi:hypothetical protein|nr:hypothetical protein [Sedimentibacter sp.]
MKDDTTEIIETIQKSMELLKCRKCGCMKKSLESMMGALDAESTEYSILLHEIQNALDLTEPSEYT